MLDSDTSPYEQALEILGLASGGAPVGNGDEALYSLALIWGELTDRVELRPEETDQAETHMVTAAREWLTVEGDRVAEAQYLDRWLHDILGYERPAPSQTPYTILKTVVAAMSPWVHIPPVPRGEQ
ncbi:hypothetical protein ACWCQ0_28825 [Streptomyces massasporeus]|uniref:Uncharacterized protein n=1 Tax=Streptomyces massasporeus TaxID=67324 RepID=A0ABW6LA72_9ACTN